MRRRGLTRVVALATLVSMLSCEFTAFATEDAAKDSKVQESTEKEEAKNDATAKDDNSSQTSENYVNERLELNYTNVSKGYTFKNYTGEKITIALKDAYDAENSTGKLTNGNYGDATNKDVVEAELDDVLTFKVNAPADGLYNVGLEYLSGEEASILVPEVEVLLNGELPFYEAKRQIFEDLWMDDKPAYDRYENEIVGVPNKCMVWQTKFVSDASYRYSTPLKLQLKKGENILTVKVTEGKLIFGDIVLDKDEEVPAYVAGKKAEGNAKVIVIQGERPFRRNDSSIRPACEYDCDLDPYDYSKKTLNIMDAASYNDAGMTMTYQIKVEKAGYYYFAFNYRQDKKVDMPVFVDIKVDGKIPNKELVSYAFDYMKSFETVTLMDSSDKKMAIYLEEGTHTISTTLSNDNLRSALETVDVVMSEIKDLSLEITKVAGSAQDKWRDIKIKDYVPDIEERMDRWIESLKEQYKILASYSTEEEDIGALTGLDKAISKLEELNEDVDEIPGRVAELSTSSSSATAFLANFITDITANNISFDRIYLYQEGSDELPGKANIFVKIWESIKRFFSSFTSQAYSTDNVDQKHLQVWINRPRQYLEIIQSLVDEKFTPQTGIEVDLCIMPDAQKLILSNAAGTAPDVAQAINYDQPFEFALRGAAVDMTKFDDYKEVFGQFEEGLLVPYVYDDTEDGKDTPGIYGIPETFYFYVMFYRTDIMDKLGIKIPQTWEEVTEILPELKNRGLDFFYFSEGTTGTRTLAMTTPFFYQYGASLYNDVCTGETTVNSEKGVEAFTALTELFTIYDLPTGVGSFYQSFRNGDMPIGVSDYFMYSMLINAAPEIENSWEITLVPGVEDENGVIQRQTAGAAQASLIMDNGNTTKIALKDGGEMDRQQAAWEYLKWWMSTDIQVEFGNILQTTYGKEFIWNTANTEAFSKLPWDSTDKKIILESMENIQESPRVPATYMVEREISNAYVEVAINGGTLRTALDEAVKRIDRETKRKLQEFGYLDGEGNVINGYVVPTIDTVKEILGTK